MFSSRTVFIVGAGASKEVKLPIGAELTAEITKLLDIRYKDGYHLSSGDRLIVQALDRHFADKNTNRRGDIEPYLRAAKTIRDAMPQALSIDNFIDAHQDNEAIGVAGKLAIARCILKSERDSSLFVDKSKHIQINYPAISDTWFSHFFKIVTQSTKKCDVKDILRNITFVTFNYDRCIEHYLSFALSNYYAIRDEAAQEIVSSASIFHPYGQVGFLPWHQSAPTVSFGGSEHDGGETLFAASQQIKTFTERHEDEALLGAIRKAISDAEVLVFLGFAFHPTNMQLLTPSPTNSVVRVYGTAKGLSDTDTSSLSSEIHTWLQKKPQHVQIELRNNLTCSQLFQEFWRSLTRPP